MAMPQRDDTIEAIKRLDALLEYAVMHGVERSPSTSSASRWQQIIRFMVVRFLQRCKHEKKNIWKD